MVDNDEGWEARAACRNKADFTELSLADASPVCQGCPVAAACLAEAMKTSDEVLVRGGLSGWQRLKFRVAARTAYNQEYPDAAHRTLSIHRVLGAFGLTCSSAANAILDPNQPFGLRPSGKMSYPKTPDQFRGLASRRTQDVAV